MTATIELTHKQIETIIINSLKFDYHFNHVSNNYDLCDSIDKVLKWHMDEKQYNKWQLEKSKP